MSKCVYIPAKTEFSTSIAYTEYVLINDYLHKDLLVSMTASIMPHQAAMQSHNSLGHVLTRQASLPLIGELTPPRADECGVCSPSSVELNCASVLIEI